MEKFTVLTAQAAPLHVPNIDTDVIIRIDRLAAYKRTELGRFAFEALRFDELGGERPEFVLNQSNFRGAPILLAGANFGCGSSRQHAVWALQGLGIRCVIAPSFGDIFFNNCFQSGVLAIALPADQVGELAQELQDSAPLAMTVDLQLQTITSPRGRVIPFDIDAGRRERLLEGLDEIQMTLRKAAELDAFEAADRERRPWIYATVSSQ